MAAEYTLWHNPRCSTSRGAMELTKESGHSFDVVDYLKVPPSAQQLHDLIAILQGNVTDLVRRDQNFKSLGLGEDDVVTADQVVDVLVKHPQLLQRPILIRHEAGSADVAIIGRPKGSVPEFLAG